MILDTLKNELKPSFTANITKDSLLHADKNGEHSCEENLLNDNENGEHICMENFNGNNLNPHNINKLSCSHKSPQETQHLCLPELCLSSVGSEHQPSKMYDSLTGKHIKYYNAGQVSQHPSLHDGNHHMSSFCLFTKYTWIGQGFLSVKEIPNHGHSITKVDWESHDSSLYLTDGCMLSEVDLGAHDSSPNHMNGFLLSEVDWGAHDSSFFLYPEYIDHDGKPNDLFTQGLWGGLPLRISSTPLMEYLKDSLDTGLTEDGVFNFKSIKEYRISCSLPDPECLESSYNLPTEWDPGEQKMRIHQPTPRQVCS